MKPHASAHPVDTYRLKYMQATPVPNALLEALCTMPETQARLLCLIVRATLGWHAGVPGLRKASVCLSHDQLKERTGRTSSAPISHALEALVTQGIIEVTTREGKPLSTPYLRRRYHRPLYFRVARSHVERKDSTGPDGG